MSEPDLVGLFFRASGSDRHPGDIVMTLQVSGNLVDPTALREWSTRLGVADVLDRARAFDPSPD